MKSVIKEIYLENRGYSEKIKPDENYWEIHNNFDKIYEKLLKTATVPQKELLNELYEAGDKIEMEASQTNFIEGFKLGAKFAIEMLT
ncbi:MAG: hypothetical protein K2L67_00895 [Clostridia bacterium]|nr:hypothetical protein [Clostridia bacterium]